MNNKFIDKKLKEFDARYPNWDIIPRDDIKQFIKEALELQEKELRMEERARHRANGCKCMGCKQDNINITYSMQLKSEQVDYDKLSEEWEKAEPEIQKKLQEECDHGFMIKEKCEDCQKPEECNCWCHDFNCLVPKNTTCNCEYDEKEDACNHNCKLEDKKV